jgi:hypothetical protein
VRGNPRASTTAQVQAPLGIVGKEVPKNSHFQKVPALKMRLFIRVSQRKNINEMPFFIVTLHVPLARVVLKPDFYYPRPGLAVKLPILIFLESANPTWHTVSLTT